MIMSFISLVVRLRYSPAYVLVKTISTKMPQLEGLEKGAILLVPTERSFTMEREKDNSPETLATGTYPRVRFH